MSDKRPQETPAASVVVTVENARGIVMSAKFAGVGTLRELETLMHLIIFWNWDHEL
jgi:hypothetical protein